MYYNNNNINIEDLLHGTTYNCKLIFSILIIIHLPKSIFIYFYEDLNLNVC